MKIFSNKHLKLLYFQKHFLIYSAYKNVRNWVCYCCYINHTVKLYELPRNLIVYMLKLSYKVTNCLMAQILQEIPLSYCHCRQQGGSRCVYNCTSRKPQTKTKYNQLFLLPYLKYSSTIVEILVPPSSNIVLLKQQAKAIPIRRRQSLETFWQKGLSREEPLFWGQDGYSGLNSIIEYEPTTTHTQLNGKVQDQLSDLNGIAGEIVVSTTRWPLSVFRSLSHVRQANFQSMNFSLSFKWHNF